MKGRSIAGMVCGILGLLNCFYGGGLLFAIAGLILSTGCIKEGYENTFTKVGKITSLIGIILSALGLVAFIACSACSAAAGVMTNY